MQRGFNFNLDEDPEVQQSVFKNRKNSRNDSIGNNSGGMRSNRDQDFDMMGETYQKNVQNRIDNQQDKQLKSGEVVQIGPPNNPNFNSSNSNHHQLSLYDIQSNLASKQLSIFNFKQTLQTIVQCLNAYQLDEITKFVKLVMDLPAFDQTFYKQNLKQNFIEVQPNDLHQVSSDLSAKSDSTYTLPSSGMQTIFQIFLFFGTLIDKCTNIDNMHLIPVIRHILNPESRFFMLPLKPQDLIKQSSQFVQNSNNDQSYQEVEEGIQDSYVSLFQFSDQVNLIKEILYFYFTKRCIAKCFKKNCQSYNLSTKMKIHGLRILNELKEASPELFAKFNLEIEETNYIIEQKSDILRMQKQQIEEYSNAFFDYCYKDSRKIQLHLSLVIGSLIKAQNSIEKKSQALKMIEKLIKNTGECGYTIEVVSEIVEQNSVMQQLMRDQTHSQLLKKLPLIVKFEYELGKIGTEKVKCWIKEAVKGHEQFFRVVQSIVDELKLGDLKSIFEFVRSLMVDDSQLLNPHTVGLIQSIVSNYNLAARKKMKKLKQQRKIINESEMQLQDCMLEEENVENHREVWKRQVNLIAEELFNYLMFLIQNPRFQSLYIPILSKHISFHVSLLLPLLEQQFRTRLSKPKDYQTFFLSILEHCLKIDLDSVSTNSSLESTSQNQNSTLYNKSDSKRTLKINKAEQSQTNEQKEPRKYHFIQTLVTNCNLYDSVFAMLCKCRFNKTITQKCLNVLSLITKYYQSLEKSHIDMLWKILGLHYTNDMEKEQFFVFVKQILKNSMGLSEEAGKHIYFQILLRLNHDYFTPRIYDCLETIFIRLNEDAWVLTYESKKNCQNYYSLKDAQPVGIDKFYYLLLWAEQKVSKKVKNFLFKLSCFNSSPKIKQKLSFNIIQSIMQYLKRNPESQTHLLLANTDHQFHLHLSRAFQFFSKFFKQSSKFIDSNQQQSSLISVTINNATKKALPPIKKMIQVDKKMLLRDFKELIRKQINLRDIELINKGKPLKADKMSLSQLNIENKNTILVEDMDVPEDKKQIEDQKLRECRQTLEGIFGEQYSSALLGYVAQKFFGEQLEKICQWVMDEQKMKELETEMNQKAEIDEEKNSLSNANQGHVDTILSFSQILMNEIRGLLHTMAINRNPKNQQLQANWALKSAIELFLKYQIDEKLAFQILQHLKSDLINSLNPQAPQFFSELSKMIKGEQLYKLVLKYRGVFLSFYLAFFQFHSHTLQNEPKIIFQSIEYFIESYLGLKSFINQLHTDQSQTQSPINQPVEWLYSLLISYCNFITLYENRHNTLVRPEIFENDLFDSINRLIKSSFHFSNHQILGLLVLINKLIDKVFANVRKTSRKLSNHHLQILLSFTDYLFYPFIFTIKTVPILTDNGIKQNYYLILLKMASSSNEILLKICGSVIKLGVQIRNRDNDNIDFKKNEFVGIQNLGCTCYINSLIQQLYHTRLPYELITLNNDEGLFGLNHTFMQLYMTVKNAINIRPMIQQVKFYGQQIIPTVQQDVQEFLISLLDYIESCQGKTIIDSIFGGSYSEQLTFFSSQNSAQTFNKHKQEHFYNITLDIKGKKNLNQALVYFFRPQTLDDKIFCEELSQKTSVVKRSFIKHFPKILIFTLKRFEFDMEKMVRRKLNDFFEFPQELDLTDFSLKKFMQEQKIKQQRQFEKPSQEMLQGKDNIEMRSCEIEMEQSDEKECHLYMLCGILIHSGSAEAGHYYSYIQRQNKWYEFNDKTVTQINLAQIIKVECFGGGESKSRNAYMLFYEKIQTNSQDHGSKPQAYQKMQIQSQSYVQVEIDKTLPLQAEQHHHGIFLEAIPQNNYFKQLVMDQNQQFIKERLLYDYYYRKFVADLIPLIRQAKENNPYKTQFDIKQEYLLSEKLVEIQKINSVMNPKMQKPIIHFQTNQMMEIEEMKEVIYEEGERIQQERKRLSRQNDIVGQILNETLNQDFI